MSIHNCLKAGAVICAFTLVPGISSAATRGVDRSQAREVNHLLNGMQYDARRVEYHVQRMDNFTTHTQFAWDTTGLELRRIRSEINDMGKRLNKLERIKNGAPLAEQQAIQNAAPLVQEMANNEDAAIRYRNSHHNGFWASSFTSYGQNLRTEADTLIRQIHRSQQVAG